MQECLDHCSLLLTLIRAHTQRLTISINVIIILLTLMFVNFDYSSNVLQLIQTVASGPSGASVPDPVEVE